jgi:hypothetical protein
MQIACSSLAADFVHIKYLLIDSNSLEIAVFVA